MREYGGHACWLNDGRDPLAEAPCGWPRAKREHFAADLLQKQRRAKPVQAAGERIGNDKVLHQIGKPPS
jgi:hypothetical protein